MGQSTGMAFLPAIEASLAALGLGNNDQDAAEEATRIAAAIDKADCSAQALARFTPRLLAALDALGATPAACAAWKAADCIICGKPIPVRRRRSSVTCSAGCSEAYREARTRNREHIRRSTVSDITPEQELAMRRRARKCPLCGVRLTDKPGLPNSKHLDHIIPLCVGGTHTHGNARILCSACNLARPKDGSDYSGPVTLWAQGEIQVKRTDRRSESMRRRMSNTETCRKGLHPWTAENIKIVSGKKVCAACREATDRKKNPPRPCVKCGTPAAMPGAQGMCPDCTDSAARKAIELHKAGGLTWNQVAALVGFGSGEGIRHAAKRLGYVAAPRPVADRRPKCRDCGQPRAKRDRWCEACTTAKAWEAVRRYNGGGTLRDIADWLGYDSITSASNLMKSVAAVEMRIGRQPKR